MTDFALKWNGDSADLQVCQNDLLVTDELDTAVIISLFTDALAPADEQLPDDTGDRRGWWGDSFQDVDGDSDGSVLWLLAREIQTQQTLERAQTYSRKALKWMIDDGVASAVSVVASYPINGWLNLEIGIAPVRGKPRKFVFTLSSEGEIHRCNEDGTIGEILGINGTPAMVRPAASQVAPGVPGEIHGADGTPAIVRAPASITPPGKPGEIDCVRDPQPPAAPSALVANSIAYNQVVLAWTDNAAGVAGFIIERCSGVACTGFLEIGRVSNGIVTYVDASVAEATDYRYRVKAFNGNGTSAATNVLDASVPPQDWFQTTLYTGDGTYPRSIAGGINVSAGFALAKRLDNTNKYAWLFKDGVDVRYFTQAAAGDAEVAAIAANAVLGAAGVTLSASGGAADRMNLNGGSYALWSLRRAPRILDVVTWTGTGAAHAIDHNLGVAPALIFFRRIDAVDRLYVGSQAMAAASPWQYYQDFIQGVPRSVSSGVWNNTAPGATQFTVGSSGLSNALGGRYVAFLIGPSAALSNDVVAVGRYVGNSSAGVDLTLGWTPRFFLVCMASGLGVQSPIQFDTARTPGFVGNDSMKYFNLLDPPDASADKLQAISGGLHIGAAASEINFNTVEYWYLAIK
jgi:phage gp46-like protein